MQKSSKEEARRKHRLSLHRRSRFHTQVPIQEDSDDVTQSNSAYMQEDQVIINFIIFICFLQKMYW